MSPQLPVKQSHGGLEGQARPYIYMARCHEGERGHRTGIDEGSELQTCACPLVCALLMHVEDVAGAACDMEGEAMDN